MGCDLESWFASKNARKKELKQTLREVIKDINNSTDIIGYIKRYPELPVEAEKESTSSDTRYKRFEIVIELWGDKI